jgi:hypothetical protein
MPCTGLPWLPSTRSPSGGTTGPSTSYIGTPYSKGGVMSGEPPLWPLCPELCLLHRGLRPLCPSFFTSFCPSFCLSFHPGLRSYICPSFPPRLCLPIYPELCPSVWSFCLVQRTEHLSTCTGTCYVIRPWIIVDTYRHVLLGSYQLVYKVSPSMGIPILLFGFLC